MNFRSQSLFLFAALSLLFFADAAPVCAQNTAVAELNNADAEKAMQLYKKLQDARKEWQDFKYAMRDKYGTELVQSLHLTDQNSLTAGKVILVVGSDNKKVLVPNDWAQGVDLSSNFKFIVPANNQQTCSSY